MAYNTKSIKKDVDGRPIPQVFNQTIDDYEPLLGQDGAARSILYGPDGQPISPTNRLPVADADALQALQQVYGALQTIGGVDFATDARLEQVRGLLQLLANRDFATEATLADALTRLESILDKLESTLAVDVTDRAERELGKVTLSGSSASEGGAPPAQILAVGGRYDATPRLLSNGQFGAIALSPEGRVLVEMVAQSYRLFTGQLITAGASAATPYIEVNGYNKLGVFVHADQPTNHEFDVEMSPNQAWYITAYSAASRPKVSNAYNNGASVQLGITQYARVRVYNTGSTDRQFDVWVTLVF